MANGCFTKSQVECEGLLIGTYNAAYIHVYVQGIQKMKGDYIEDFNNSKLEHKWR